MPQLDKYIFLNQIIALTIVFFLIYAYIRVHGMRIVGGLLYYRIRRLGIYNLVNGYMKRASKNSHWVWTFFGNNLLPKFNNMFRNGLVNYEEKSNLQLNRINKKLINSRDVSLKTFLYKVSLENLRLNKINKKFL